MNRGEQFPESAFGLMQSNAGPRGDDFATLPEPQRQAPSDFMISFEQDRGSQNSGYDRGYRYQTKNNGDPVTRDQPITRATPGRDVPQQMSSSYVPREYLGERTVKKAAASPGVLTVEEWERRVAEKEKNQRLGHGAFTDAELLQQGIQVEERVPDSEINQRVSQHVSQAIRKHDEDKSPSLSPYTNDQTFAPARSPHELSDQELRGLKDASRMVRDPHIVSAAQTPSYYDDTEAQVQQPLSVVDRDPILQKVLERGRQQRSIESQRPNHHEERSDPPPASSSVPGYTPGADGDFQAQTLSEIINRTKAPLPPPSNSREQFHESGAYSSMASSYDSLRLPRPDDTASYKQIWDQRDSRQQLLPPASLHGEAPHDGRRRVVNSAPHMQGVPGTLGIGFKQSGTAGEVRVAGLQEGLPAALDGRIKVGDVLLRINHNPRPRDLHSVVAKLQGDVGEAVRLTLDRPELSPAGTYDVTLVRLPMPDTPPRETELSRAQAAAQRAREEKDKSNLCRVCMPVL